jgi:hypothetical protein
MSAMNSGMAATTSLHALLTTSCVSETVNGSGRGICGTTNKTENNEQQNNKRDYVFCVLVLFVVSFLCSLFLSCVAFFLVRVFFLSRFYLFFVSFFFVALSHHGHHCELNLGRVDSRAASCPSA